MEAKHIQASKGIERPLQKAIRSQIELHPQPQLPGPRWSTVNAIRGIRGMA